MNKTNYFFLLLMFIAPPLWGEEEMYLEGISVLGNHKSAYLSMGTGKATVREGDMIGTWRVTQIKQNSIFLSSNTGKSTELLLHSRLPVPSEEENENNLSEEEMHPDSNEGLPQEEPSEESSITEQDSYAEKSSSTESLPKGYRKVRTPFGEIVVPEQTSSEAINPHLPPSSENMQSISEVSPDAHKIKTPFGEFVVKETKKEPPLQVNKPDGQNPQ